MAKLTLADVSNILGSPTSAQNTINSNSRLIETALENTVSRDGTTPNQMSADFDMNNNDILNVKDLSVVNLTLNGVEVGTSEVPLTILTEILEARDQAEAWAEGTEPGGVGTRSAKEWAQIASSGVVFNQVTSLSALKALDTNIYKIAYLNLGERSGIFAWRTGDYSSQITADVQNGIYVKADAVASTAGSWVRQDGWSVSGVNVGWFGAVGDGTTNDSTAVQAAINTGYNVNFGQSSYSVTGLTVTTEHQEIRGAGRRTRLLDSSATADLFTVGDGTNAIRGVNFSDFLVWTVSGVSKTAGHVINARFGSRLIVKNVYFGCLDDYVANGNAAVLWDGIYFDRFAECAVYGGQFCLKNKGVKARGNLDQSFGVELTIDQHTRFVFCGNYAIHIGGACGGVYFERLDVSNSLRGVQIDKALQNAPNREIFISKSATFDTCDEWGMVIGDDGAALVQSSGWYCSCGTATTGGNAGGGVLVLPTTAGNVRIDMAGATIYNNRGDGIRALAGIWTVTGSKINLNGQGTAGGCGFISEAAAVVANLTGNSITNNGNATRGVGVQFAHASNDNYIVTDNDLRGNGIVGFSSVVSPAFATTRLVSNNLGFVTENGGIFTGTTNGSGDVFINHGLAGTPRKRTVALASAAFVGSIQIYAASSTQLSARIWNTSGAPVTSTSVTVDWEAML